jgi:hypothetical protein
MKAKKIIYLIILFLITSSCKKGILETRVDGKVINKKTGEVVPNQPVYVLLVKRTCSFGCSTSIQEIASTATDSKGKYQIVFKIKNQFNFKNEGDYMVQGTANNDNDRDFYKSEILEGIKERRATKIDIELEPKAKIKVRFKSLSPINDINGLKYVLFENGVKGYEQYVNGKNIDTEIMLNLKIGVESNNTLAYSFVRNGIEIKRDTSVFIKSFETKSININF